MSTGNGSFVSPNIISLLHQRYFEATRTMPLIISHERFFRLLNEQPVRHQANALSHAVAMAGASLSDDFPHLESLCYYSARHYVEMAERQEDGADFLNLEMLQALLLIIRFEFSEAGSKARAWMTQGRATRLAKMLCLDAVDADRFPLSQDSLRFPMMPAVTAAELEERRRTFWVAFNMDFFIASLTNTLPHLQAAEILTHLPCLEVTTDESPIPGMLLRDAIAQTRTTTVSPWSRLIIATALGNIALKHLKHSADQSTRRYSADGSMFDHVPEYDFWTHHFELDKKILEYIALSPFSSQTSASDDPLLATAHLTLLGVSILIHMKAFERALQTGFPDSLAVESRVRFEKAAMEISDAMQSAGAFGRVNLKVCNHIGMYLMWPVSLAVKVQLLCLKDPSRSMDVSTPGPQNVIPSLRVLDSAIGALKVSSTQFDEVFEEVRAMLENDENSGLHSPKHPDARRRNTSSSSLNGFLF